MMNTRKANHGTPNDNKQHAISYIREFSCQASVYQNMRTDESLLLLNRSSALLSTAIQPQLFTPTNVEIAKFFIDLHALMTTLDVESDAMWSCLTLLQHCSRNLEARQAIVDEYRFVPLLSFILKRTQRGDKILRLLTLLQDLTYGIRITLEEPYLIVLLEQLVHIVYTWGEEGEDSYALLALSILVNLCYKNFVALFIFMRTVNISSFSRRIENYGMLANKMLIILSEDIYACEPRELYRFLRSAFASVAENTKQWNVPQMRHTVEFLLDSKAHAGLNSAMRSYANYCEDIEHLLEQIESRSSMDDSNDDSRRHQQFCMGLIFQLILHVLELGAIPEADGSENVISLDSNLPRIFEVLCNWFDSDICVVDAVNLLNGLVRLAKRETIMPLISRDPSIIIKLIATSECADSKAQHTTAILQLLLSLLHQPKTEKLILSKITESYFDKILAPLLPQKSELINKEAITLPEIEKSIFCLLLLINFAGIAKKAYFDKCCTLLQLEQLQFALGRALFGGNEKVCKAVFQISQFEHFPQAAVANHIAIISAKIINNAPHCTQNSNIGEQWRNLNIIFKNHLTFVDKEITERLNALIDVILTSHRNNQLQNVPASQIIELFNYRIENSNCVERSMQQRLENASNQITSLTQRISLQNTELNKYHTMNFELHISQERLQTQYQDFKQQKDKLKTTAANLLKQLSEQNEILQINEKRLSVKTSEIIVLQKECNALKTELLAKTEDLEKLQQSNKENCIRIEKLKKSINSFEHELKDKKRIIDETERDLVRTQKALDEQMDAKKKSDDLISLLETQLQEKKEQIDNYETELSETEELRKTIMSLMESKKPKRKA